ncbi:MAG: nucleoside hydrolase [Myxococcales bacterium]
MGVTTVYGHSHLRAAVAQKVVGAWAARLGRPAPKVVAGESTPLGTHMPVWHTGFEGHEILPPEEVAALMRRSDFVVENGLAPGTRHDAARFIVEQVRARPGEVTLACIGALSNVATALRLDPGIAPLVRRIVFMGTGSRLRAAPDGLSRLPMAGPKEPVVPGRGVPWLHYPNLNIVGDTLAAVRVFESGIPVDVVGDTVTNQLWWGAPDEASASECRALREAREPAESAVVGQLLDVWLRYRTVIFGRPVAGTCPHDPLTVAEAIYPRRFLQFSAPGHLLVHEWAGFSTFVCGAGGPHRLARTVDAGGFLELLGRRLVPRY